MLPAQRRKKSYNSPRLTLCNRCVLRSLRTDNFQTQTAVGWYFYGGLITTDCKYNSQTSTEWIELARAVFLFNEWVKNGRRSTFTQRKSEWNTRRFERLYFFPHLIFCLLTESKPNREFVVYLIKFVVWNSDSERKSVSKQHFFKCKWHYKRTGPLNFMLLSASNLFWAYFIQFWFERKKLLSDNDANVHANKFFSFLFLVVISRGI